MLQILLRRLPLMALTFVVSSMLIFVASEVLPIDVARNMLGQFAPQEAVDALNERLGINRPVVERYLDWMRNVLRGDFGISTSQQQPVGGLIVKHAINSGILAGTALIIIMPLGMALGVIAGLYRNRAADRTISLFSLGTASAPEFVVGVLLLVVFAIWLKLLPGSSALVGVSNAFGAPSKLVLPVLTLVIVDVGYVARMTRVATIDVMQSQYIRAARLRGLPMRRVVFSHALRTALLTPVTVMMLHINWLIGGIVVTETIYGYPGLGQLMLTAASSKDVQLLEAGVLFFVVVAMVSQFIADILYAWMNPRARSGVVA